MTGRVMRNLPSTWTDTHFSFFLFYETRVRPSGCKRMQIAGWRRVPKLRAQDYTLQNEIPGHKKEGSKGRRGKRERERGDRIMDHDAADINNATCVSGSWNLNASAQHRRLSLPTWHECILLCAMSAKEKGGSSFPKGARERRDESLKNLINGTPVI